METKINEENLVRVLTELKNKISEKFVEISDDDEYEDITKKIYLIITGIADCITLKKFNGLKTTNRVFYDAGVDWFYWMQSKEESSFFVDFQSDFTDPLIVLRMKFNAKEVEASVSYVDDEDEIEKFIFNDVVVSDENGLNDCDFLIEMSSKSDK